MKMIILFASITIAAGLLLINIYNSLVDAKCWGSNIPQSIDVARQYYKVFNPGNFYRLFSPVNQVLALIVLILFWKSPARPYVAVALVLYVAADAFTFAYFYPRNDIMFKSPITDVDAITKAWKEWSAMNWLRSAIVLTGLVCSFVSLHKIYTDK